MSAASRPKRYLAVVSVVAVGLFGAWWVWPSSSGGDQGGSSASSADQSPERAGGPGDGSREGESIVIFSGRSGEDGRREAAEGLTDARGEVARFLRASSRALGSADRGREAAAGTATGAALDAARAAAAEFEDNGWRQIGAPRIVSASVFADQSDASPPRMTVRACVDSSDVDVVDESGSSVRTGSYANRSLMLFDLVRRGGDWLVEQQSFPDDPDC